MNLDGFIQRHGLPATFAVSAERCYLPFAKWMAIKLEEFKGGTYVLGINGAQGTGKSTLADLISDYLGSEYDRNVVVISIDDLYLTRAERKSLSDKVHPLLMTRGVPGTHDVALGLALFNKLKSLKQGESLDVPRFDKSHDDRYPVQQWTTVTGPIDLIIFEGWCVGSQASDESDLHDPINALESSQDADGSWRRYVNAKLSIEYRDLFATLDSLLFLKVPDFDAVFRWRLEQEHKLKQRAGNDGARVMSDEQVANFIRYYERITRNNIAVLPDAADAMILLGGDHSALSLQIN